MAGRENARTNADDISFHRKSEEALIPPKFVVMVNLSVTALFFRTYENNPTVVVTMKHS